MSNNPPHPLLGKQKKGTLFVISAPSGTGKTTLVQLLSKEFSHIKKSISYTTRAPRPGEVPGEDYHFLTKEQFLAMRDKGEFLEHATVFDEYYGTPKKAVQAQLDHGFGVVLVIDTQGALQIKAKRNGEMPAVLIFIQPPSLTELESRLHKRGTETKEDILLRLQEAEQELKKLGDYDYLIMNVDIRISYEVLRSIVIAESHRIQTNI